MAECKFEGCSKETGFPGARRGWCSMHYARWRRHGDPTVVLKSRTGRRATIATGEVFGDWTVLGEAPRETASAKRFRRFYLCRCVCGTEKAIVGYSLRNGNSTSCGCNGRLRQIEQATRHGHNRVGQRTPTYRTWLKMRERCSNPDHEHFCHYGGRGIKVCNHWQESFEAFLRDMGERPKGKTLDRIDPDGDYEPGNCRWATHSEQMKNRRR